MLYHDAWNLSQSMMINWWNHSDVDYPTLAFTAHRDKPMAKQPVPECPKDIKEKYLNMDYVLPQQENYMAEMRFFGAAYPNFNTNIGPGSLAIYLGCEPGFSEETVWFDHLPEMQDDPESVPLPEMDLNAPWLKTHLDIIKRAAAQAKGKCLATVPDLVEGMDILASFRGAQNLLMDMYDRPEWIHKWLRRLNDLYFPYFDMMHDLVKLEDGSNAFTAFQVWGPGKTAKIQCDFSAMMGPDMFAEFVAPYLAEQAKRLDYTVYHLDGKEEFPHLEHLLKIDELQAIQWTAAAGDPGVEDEQWYDFYHKVLDGGKSLLLLGGISRERIGPMIKELGTKGVYYRLSTLDTEAEAIEICNEYGIPLM